MRARLLTCAAIVAVVAAACGSDDAATVTEPTAASTAEATLSNTPEDSDGTVAPAGPGDVPAFDMTDVHTGQTVNLQSVVDGSAPLLLWFWAPH